MAHLALMFVLVALSTDRGETPALFREESISPSALAEAVNHFVSVGEQRTIKELEAVAAEFRGSDLGRAIRSAERVGWVCRILYQPKGKRPLRAPRIGRLSLDFRTDPLENWPLYPVAVPGSTYLVLAEWRSIGGMPESAEDSLADCRRNGRFRTALISVPNRDQARRDAGRLRESNAWKLIKWGDRGHRHGVSVPESTAWDFINRQAEAVPTK